MKGYFDDCMTVEQLEQEHKRLVIQLHPDRNPNDPEATAAFQEMQAQYEERKAELAGDYTKARKGRERREREARERAERERKERERRKVEQVVEAARLNKQKSHLDWKAGDYVYARAVEWMRAFSAEECCTNDVLRMALKQGVKDECVVLIEAVFDMSDNELMDGYLSSATDGEIYGGWEVLQTVTTDAGFKRSKRVPKVVMFRSEHYCLFGNPQGDQVMTEYYLPVNYETMFSDHLHRISAGIAREQAEALRIEAERKAKLLAEQKPLIEEWSEKLIAISAGLSDREKQEVAVANLKTMLKAKFPGTTFKVKADKYALGNVRLEWEDGPVTEDVDKVIGLFEPWLKFGNEPTPWQERYGRAVVSETNRKMSVLTKARILQQLGSVTEAFSTSAINDEVTVSDFDWMMLHLLVGIEVGKGQRECISTMHADGSRSVSVMAAVRFVFQHSSYAKATKAKKKKAA